MLGCLPKLPPTQIEARFGNAEARFGNTEEQDLHPVERHSNANNGDMEWAFHLWQTVVEVHDVLKVGSSLIGIIIVVVGIRFLLSLVNDVV